MAAPSTPTWGRVRWASRCCFSFTSHSGGTPCTFTSHGGGTSSTFVSHSGGTSTSWSCLHLAALFPTGWSAQEASPLRLRTRGTPRAPQPLPPPVDLAQAPPGTVFPVHADRVFARPGEDSTSAGRCPRVRRPPPHLDLYDLVSAALRSGGSHVESPAAAPTADGETPSPPPAAGAPLLSAPPLLSSYWTVKKKKK